MSSLVLRAFSERISPCRDPGRGHATPLAIRLPFHCELKEPAPDRRTRRYRVDDGRIPLHNHLGIIQDKTLVPAAGLLVLFPVGRPQIGLGPAGIALPRFGVKGQLPFDVSGRRGCAEILHGRQHGFLDALARRFLRDTFGIVTSGHRRFLSGSQRDGVNRTMK